MSKIKLSYLSLITIFLYLAVGCDDGINKEPTNYDELIHDKRVSKFEPVQGGHGTEVLISGFNFPTETSKVSVSINDVEIPVLRSNEEQILVQIPKNKLIGSAPIVVSLDGEVISSANKFTYMRTRTVTTLAGTGVRGYKDGAGNEAMFSFTTDWGESRRGGIDVDDKLNVYVSDAANQCIRKIAPDGTVSTVAGQGPNVEITDWGIEWRNDNEGKGSYNAQIRPTDVKVDSKGNMFVTDDHTGAMVRFNPDGKAHYLGYGGGVNCIAIDEANSTLYLNDHNAGIIYTSSMNNYGPDPKPKTELITGVMWSAGMVVDKRNGDLYLVNHDANKIEQYKRGMWGTPILVAGSGTEGYVDGNIQNARFNYPWGIAMDADGNLYIGGNGSGAASTNALDQSIRFVDQNTGHVSTFAGSGLSGYSNGSFAVATYGGLNNMNDKLPINIRFSAPTGVAVDKNGVVYVLDRGNNVVRKIETE